MKEKILDKYYEPKMHWKSVNRANVLIAMEHYHSQKVKEMGLSSNKELQSNTKTACDHCGK